jgi:ABC-type antimicrobial peptide transport system permease subunit
VVGLARDIPAVFSASSVPVVYVPLTRRNFAHPAPFGLTLLVRGAAGPGTLEGIRHVLTQIDPNLSVFNVHTLREQLDQTDAYLKFAGGFYAGIGMFGLILASVGLGGVTAYSVARRRKELGIRMALGSGPGQAVRLVLREGTALVLVGSLIGYAGAVALTRVLSTTTEQIARIFQAGTRDPLLLIGAPLLLAGLAMLACYLPARKITKIDPLVALREE